MAILFISGLAPDNKKYWTSGFTRSGNNALLGIAEGLCKFANEDVTFISHPCRASFPHDKIWIASSKDQLDNGTQIYFLPTLNLTIIKTIIWGREIRKIIKKWANNHKGEILKVITYNTYHPSISAVYKACKSVGAKLYSILYDLGIPPKRLGLNRLTMFGYRQAEKIAHNYIPLLDGRIIINEKIASHYAPRQHYLLVDGGVNQYVISNLFPLKESKSKKLVFVCAGMLWDQNGTKLILETLKLYPELNIKMIFAGKGNDVPLIEEKAKVDERIQYVGMLDMEELFKLYESSDILLNLRLEEEEDFHFPSKLLEYLVTGKHVISTPVAHAERDYGQFVSFLHDKTPEGLAKLMVKIIETGKHELYKKGLEARKFMLENRNWDIQTKRILEYINKN